MLHSGTSFSSDKREVRHSSNESLQVSDNGSTTTQPPEMLAFDHTSQPTSPTPPTSQTSQSPSPRKTFLLLLSLSLFLRSLSIPLTLLPAISPHPTTVVVIRTIPSVVRAWCYRVLVNLTWTTVGSTNIRNNPNPADAPRPRNENSDNEDIMNVKITALITLAYAVTCLYGMVSPFPSPPRPNVGSAIFEVASLYLYLTWCMGRVGVKVWGGIEGKKVGIGKEKKDIESLRRKLMLVIGVFMVVLVLQGLDFAMALDLDVEGGDDGSVMRRGIPRCTDLIVYAIGELVPSLVVVAAMRRKRNGGIVKGGGGLGGGGGGGRRRTSKGYGSIGGATEENFGLVSGNGGSAFAI